MIWLFAASLATNVKVCDGDGNPCGVPIAYGIDLNVAENGIGLSNFKGTLDSLLNTTPLVYQLYKSGPIGWPTEDVLKTSGFTIPTSRACYDSNYFCPPGPCAVLDVNYLEDIQNFGLKSVIQSSDPSMVYGKSHCGPVFGTQMRITKDNSYYPADQKKALQKLPGPLPSTVQKLIPANDRVNDIPAWWYETFDDWATQNNAKLRKNGKPCFARAVPDWMIPYRQSARGKTREFEDEDVSNQRTTMQGVRNTTAPYGSQQDNPESEEYPYYTLCDADFLKGVFLGFRSDNHVQLRNSSLVGGAKFNAVRLENITTIAEAITYYFDSYRSAGKFCQGDSASTCDFPKFLYENWKTEKSICNATTVCTQYKVASLAMLAGQLFTVVRPCESFRSRQGKLMAATFNHWRRAYWNPGNNRAAFEHHLGCSTIFPGAACEPVRAEIEWSSPSACVPMGGCSTVGYDCCTATGSPGLTEDTRRQSAAAESMPYAYTTEHTTSTCGSELGNEQNEDHDLPINGALWPYKNTESGKKKPLYRCGILMETHPYKWCKYEHPTKNKIKPGNPRLFATPLCHSAPPYGISNYESLFNTGAADHHIKTVEDSIFKAYGYGGLYSPTFYMHERDAPCQDHRVLSAYYTFLVNCIALLPSKPALVTLVDELKQDGVNNVTDNSKMHCGIMEWTFAGHPGDDNSARVYDTCLTKEAAHTGPNTYVTGGSSQLTWSTVVNHAVSSNRNRLLPDRPFVKDELVTDTSVVGMQGPGITRNRHPRHTEKGKCTKDGCDVKRHPPDLNGDRTTKRNRFMQPAYIGQGTGPLDGDCDGYFTWNTYVSIATAITVYELDNKPVLDIDQPSLFMKNASSTEKCGWDAQYTTQFDSHGTWMLSPNTPTRIFEVPLKPSVLPLGFWLGVFVAPTALTGIVVSALSDAIAKCTEYRFFDCIGVTVHNNASFELVTLADLSTNGVSVEHNAQFYPVPCYEVQSSNSLFGCSASPTARELPVYRNFNLGVPMWAPPIPAASVGSQESYLLDGLGHYTANARFTLDTGAFAENKLGRGMASVHDKANGVSMDFDIHRWKETTENDRVGARIPLPAFAGAGGVATSHQRGFKYVPEQSSGIADDVQKTGLFGWASMFDSDAWLLDRVYQFKHPSRKNANSFLYYAAENDTGIEVVIDQETYRVDDVFVRAMKNEVFQPDENHTHLQQWVDYFYKPIRAASRGSTVNCDGVITLGGTNETGCAFNDTSSAVRTEYNDPLQFTASAAAWTDFSTRYEAICDLHVCDIIQSASDLLRNLNTLDNISGQPLSFNCVPRGYTYFQRGAAPVDAGVALPATPQAAGSGYVQSTFGVLGYALTSIEASILLDVMLRRSGNMTVGSLVNSWVEAVDTTGFIKDLWYACSRVAGTDGTLASIGECVDVVKAQTVRGFPDTVTVSPWVVNDNVPPKNTPQTPADILSMYVSDKSAWGHAVDYTTIDKSSLFVEHRDAVPVDMGRSAAYSNTEEHNNAIPCDCDNQQIVWMCNRLLPADSDDPEATHHTFASDVPRSKYMNTAAEYGDSIQLVECGYSWFQPPVRTPKIGLYVPSKIDLFEVYERDIFSGYRHTPIGGNCSGYNSGGGNTSGAVSPPDQTCARNARKSALLRLCATEIFSLPMAPRAKKLKNLLFTGQHPTISGLASQTDLESLYSRGLITDADYTEIKNDIASGINNGQPLCWQKQVLTVFDSPCLRYPFGAQHHSTIGSDDADTTKYMNNIYNNESFHTQFKEGEHRVFHDAYRISTIGWQGYCELETEAANLNPTTWEAKSPTDLKFRYCQNDPLTIKQRETVCGGATPHFVMYGWTLTDRLVKNSCNYDAKLCIIIPGYESSGLISSIMASPDLPDVRGFTFLVMPFHYDIISEYFARRVLYEVGNSFGRSLDVHMHPVTPAMRSRYPVKHPLDLAPRDTSSFADADIQLHDNDTDYTGLPVDVDAFAVLAKLPATLVVAEAIRLMTIISAQINSTCRNPVAGNPARSAWKPCVTDADRQSGVFLMPHLNAPAAADHIRELGIDEVYRPYPSDLIIVDVPHVTIRSGVATMPLRFDPNPFVVSVKDTSTCVHIEVGSTDFRLFPAVFNQTLCAHLDASKQVPIIFSGADVSRASVDMQVIFGGGATKTESDPIIGTGVLVLGDDNRMFEAAHTIRCNNMTMNIDLFKAGSTWNAQKDLYFHAAVAKAEGNIRLSHTLDSRAAGIRTVLVQERQLRNGSGVSPTLVCEDSACTPDNTSVYSCGRTDDPPASTDLCRIFNVTRATGVFGSQYEAQIFHEAPDRTYIYMVLAIILSVFGFCVVIINFGLLVVGNRLVHKMIGLRPPMEHTDTVDHFQHTVESSKRGQKKIKLHISHADLKPNQWKTFHPSQLGRHLLDFKYGVGIQLQSGKSYSVELLARDLRNGHALPEDIVRNHPELIARLKTYNHAII